MGDGMSDAMMNTREVARYLDIHEKQVYALVKAGKIPCTKATGKWIFPKQLVDEWIETDARSGLKQARSKQRRIAGALLAAGSNDPVLDILQAALRAAHPELYIFSANTGSMEGLSALNQGYTDLAWTHLLDPESGDYNIPYLVRCLPEVKTVVVNLFHRRVGLLTAPGNPLGLKGIEDLARPGVRIVNRQHGSGIRVLFDRYLQELKISPTRIEGYDHAVTTHLAVGLVLLGGEADAGIASVAVSHQLGLPFLPLREERFDMVLSQAMYFEKGVQALIDILRSDAFHTSVRHLGNYDFRDSGKILFAA